MRPFQWYPFVDFHSVHRTNRTHNNIHAGIHPFNVYYDSCLVRGSPDFFHLSYKSMCFAMYYTVHKRHAAPVFHLLGSSDWTLPDQLLWGEVLQGVLCRLRSHLLSPWTWDLSCMWVWRAHNLLPPRARSLLHQQQRLWVDKSDDGTFRPTSWWVSWDMSIFIAQHPTPINHLDAFYPPAGGTTSAVGRGTEGEERVC